MSLQRVLAKHLCTCFTSGAAGAYVGINELAESFGRALVYLSHLSLQGPGKGTHARDIHPARLQRPDKDTCNTCVRPLRLTPCRLQRFGKSTGPGFKSTSQCLGLA
jgi:hypothetical protein